MPLIERFTPGGNFYPDGKSSFAVLREIFQRIAEVRDTVDQQIIQKASDNAAVRVGEAITTLEPGNIVRGRASTPDSTGAVWHQTTESGHLLPLGYTREGRLSEFTREVFREDLMGAEQTPDHPEYARLWITADGTQRLILGVRWDGTVEIPGLTGAPAPGASLARAVHTDAPYTRGSDVLPVHTDMSHWGIWGSSSAAGLHTEFDTYARAHGATTTTLGGKGSEQAEQIAARLGSRPFLVEPTGGTATIAPGAAIPVTVLNGTSTDRFLRTYWGTWHGMAGQLRWNTTTSTMEFARGNDTGAALTVAGAAPVEPSDGLNARAALTLLWMGKNNTPEGGAADKVIDLTDEAHDWLAPLHKRVLVLGHFVNTGTGAASVARTNIDAINAAHAARYGRTFVDVQGYLMSAQLWTDTGITPTQEDLDKQATGNKPPSVSNDDGHLNAAGYAAVRGLVAARLTELRWI